MSLIFFDEILPLRIAAKGSEISSPAGLRPLIEELWVHRRSRIKTIQAVAKSGVPNRPRPGCRPTCRPRLAGARERAFER